MSETETREIPLCFAFNSDGGCTREDCRYRHEKGDIPTLEERREALKKRREEARKRRAPRKKVVHEKDDTDDGAKVSVKRKNAPNRAKKAAAGGEAGGEKTSPPAPSGRYHNIKLFYFDFPGKGEPIRLALTAAGVDFEDVRVSSEKFQEMKANGQLALGQLPCLEVTERKSNRTSHIVQSASILRFVGRALSLPNRIYPSDHVKAAYIDTILDAEIDLFTGLAVSRYRGRYGFESIGNPGDAVFDQVRKDLNDDVIPRHLGSLEKMLESNHANNKWFGNTRFPSIADFCLVPRLGWLREHGEGISNEILKPFPKIVALMEAFYEDPVIAKYYETRELRI